MGLFEKKMKKASDDFDSPVEQINLSAPPIVASKPTPLTPKIAAQAPVEIDEAPLDYGIDKAIELMRTLPAENVELVVAVVKKTLESIKIKVPTIIKDADKKLARIEGRIDTLKKEISDLENEISTRRKEISNHETDHQETTMVKERLVLAEGSNGKSAAQKSPPPIPAPMSTQMTAPMLEPDPSPVITLEPKA